MSTPEGLVKTWVTRLMLQWYPDAFKYCPPGGRFGRAGLPDFVYLISGVFVGIETKSLSGSVTGIQMFTLKKLAKCGAIVAVVKGKDLSKMEALKNAIDERIRQTTII